MAEELPVPRFQGICKSVLSSASFWSLVVAMVAVGVAYWQLSAANRSLRAANTIALAREEREISDRIANAGSDAIMLNEAYDRYGDHFSYAAYLFAQGQIDAKVWENIRNGFCQMLPNPAFDLWYQRNVNSVHLKEFFPSFGEEAEKCQNS